MRRIAPQLRLIRRRSWGSNASTLRRFHPLDGRRWRFRNVGPACRSTNLSLPRPFSSGDRFVQPLHLSCIGRLRRIEDVIASRLGGLISRRRSDRSDSSRPIDPALGFVLLQGCGRTGHAAWAPRQPFWRATSVVSSPRVIRQSPARSSRAHPLLGLRRPSCADVTGISSGCIHLHGAVSAWLRRRRPFSVL
jgi:hypothetical protein